MRNFFWLPQKFLPGTATSAWDSSKIYVVCAWKPAIVICAKVNSSVFFRHVRPGSQISCACSKKSAFPNDIDYTHLQQSRRSNFQIPHTPCVYKSCCNLQNYGEWLKGRSHAFQRLNTPSVHGKNSCSSCAQWFWCWGVDGGRQLSHLSWKSHLCCASQYVAWKDQMNAIDHKTRNTYLSLLHQVLADSS